MRLLTSRSGVRASLGALLHTCVACNLLAVPPSYKPLARSLSYAQQRLTMHVQDRWACANAFSIFVPTSRVTCSIRVQGHIAHPLQATGVWRNGSASDSRSEGWEFESLCPHFRMGLRRKCRVSHFDSALVSPRPADRPPSSMPRRTRRPATLTMVAFATLFL